MTVSIKNETVINYKGFKIILLKKNTMVNDTYVTYKIIAPNGKVYYTNGGLCHTKGRVNTILNKQTKEEEKW